mgnify:FL=1|tara:strand:+ start:349 stop:609 length:261 start_codon:yes stop_codon:yes gene_type:complete
MVNSSNIPINQYSLQQLENWLHSLGAKRDIKDPCVWHLKISTWEATINFEQEDLSVVWYFEGKLTRRLFSYCINREDVENAILQGP